jgi:hypothetical protein
MSIIELVDAPPPVDKVKAVAPAETEAAPAAAAG